MGRYEAATWRPPTVDGVPRAYRRPGRYWIYVPDLLVDQPPLTLSGALVERVAEATGSLAAVTRGAADVDLDGFVSLALRSESVASSVIEGVSASARSVALADFTGHGSAAALEVARNAHLMRRATQEMARSGRVRLDDVVDLQSMLVPRLPGLRREQVWIGGPSPLVAAYVPPSHERVPELMADLVQYLDQPTDAPVIAAAVVHAQFETIHPFRDGNGRVGRALTHTVLARANGTSMIVPFSSVLAARKQTYIDGLVAWRTVGDVDERVRWVEVFADALNEAAVLTERLVGALRRLQDEYRGRLRDARGRSGGRQPRAGSAVLRLLDDVAAHPVDTAASASQRLGVSTVAARDALEELASAGILRTIKIDKGKTVSYVATEVLELADTGLPTSAPPATEPPSVRRPTRTERNRRGSVCGHPLPQSQGWCTEPFGHEGAHASTGNRATQG